MSVQRTRQIRRILALIIVLASSALVVTVVVRQLRAPGPESAARVVSPGVDMSLAKPSFSEFRGSEKLWELTADRADYDKKAGLVMLTKAQARLLESAAGSISISADSGSYQESGRLVKMRNKVHAVSKRGMVFDTSRVDYRIDQGLIITDDQVRVSDGRLTLQAHGMELQVEQETVSFKGPVEAVIEGYREKR